MPLPMPDNVEQSVRRWIEQLRSAETASDRWTQVVEELAALGHRALPFILDALVDRSLNVHIGITTVLRRIGPTAVFDLIEELNSGTARTRAAAAEILSNLVVRDDTPVQDLIPALAKSLRDQDSEVRMWSAAALCLSGFEAEPAIPELIEVLFDEDWPVREWAARALGALGPVANQAAPSPEGKIKRPETAKTP